MLDLLPDDDQQALVDAVAAFLIREMPVDRLRPRPGEVGIPVQRDRWPDFVEMGWLGLGVPDAIDGSGYGIIELMLVFREFGRYLLPLELLATTVAARAVAKSNPDMARKLAVGEIRAGLALPFAGVDVFHLVGASEARYMIGIGTQLEIFDARIFENMVRVPCLDLSVDFTRANLIRDEKPRRESASYADEARVLVCAMLTGVAEVVRDIAVGYAKSRQQFGQTIGSFQAIKHICADMAVRAEAAHCITASAAASLAAGDPGGRLQAWEATSIASRAAIENTSQAIQTHGALGFTQECDLHLFLRRAHVLDALLGTAIDRRRAILSADL